jgi:hypothetical protein
MSEESGLPDGSRRYVWTKASVTPPAEWQLIAAGAGPGGTGIPSSPAGQWIARVNDIWDTGYRNRFGGRPTIGAWHHVAMRLSAETLSLFVDGVSIGAASNSGDDRQANGSGTFNIGFHPYGNGSWDGQITQVSFWSRALADSRIAEHRGAMSLGIEAYEEAVADDAPNAWFPMQDSSGSLTEVVAGLHAVRVGSAPVTYRANGPHPTCKAVTLPGGPVEGFAAPDHSMWSSTNFTVTGWVGIRPGDAGRGWVRGHAWG